MSKSEPNNNSSFRAVNSGTEIRVKVSKCLMWFYFDESTLNLTALIRSSFISKNSEESRVKSYSSYIDIQCEIINQRNAISCLTNMLHSSFDVFL